MSNAPLTRLKKNSLSIGNWIFDIGTYLTFPKGFTLIELLVVISIIGILASMLFVNIIGFRERVRDTQRKKDLLQIQSALELYRSDTATYPGNLPGCSAPFSSGTTVYMQKMPCDPLGSPSWGGTYKYSLSGNSYILYACLENANDPDRDGAPANTKQSGCGSAQASHTVASP